MWMRHLPWILALVWLGIRFVMGEMWDVEKAQNAGVLINILFILTLVFLGINRQYRTLQGKESSFFDDFKVCMKPAMLYVLVAVACIGVFYAWISNDIQELRSAYTETFNTGIADEANRTKFLSEHPDLAGKSVEELMAMNKENVERNVSVQTRFMGSLLALTFIGFAYSLLAVFFWRTFVRKWAYNN